MSMPLDFEDTGIPITTGVDTQKIESSTTQEFLWIPTSLMKSFWYVELKYDEVASEVLALDLAGE